MKDKKKPLYLQVKDQLLRAIGRMTPGKNRLPSETVLTEKLGVGRSTLREAINSLVLDKIVKKIPGKGMVAFPSIQSLSFRMDHYADFRELLEQSGEVRIESTDVELCQPSERMMRRMPKARGSRVYRWIRRHYVDERLVIHAQFEIPEEHFTKSSKGENPMEFKTYLKEYITEDIACHISWIKSYRLPKLAAEFETIDEIIESWDQVFKDHGDRSICFCQLSFHPEIIDLSIVITP